MDLRLMGRRLLAIWLCFLRNWSSKRTDLLLAEKTETLRSRKTFLVRNQVVQEELRRIFTPYHHLCPGCGSKCCKEPIIPFSEIDGILYGDVCVAGIERDARQKPWDLSLCLDSQFLYRKLRQFSWYRNNGAQQGKKVFRFCPALSETGCTIPWGRRPAICVFCACPRFLEEMSWNDFGRYMWINLKYLGHLTRSLWAVVSEWRWKEADRQIDLLL